MDSIKNSSKIVAREVKYDVATIEAGNTDAEIRPLPLVDKLAANDKGIHHSIRPVDPLTVFAKGMDSLVGIDRITE